MSAHSAAPAHGHDAARHDDGAEASEHDPWAEDDGHHGEPPPPEPESPPWLPLLGGALFILALLGFLLTQQEEPSAPSGDASAEAADTADAPAPTAAPRNPALFGTGRIRPLRPQAPGNDAPAPNP